MKLVSPEYCSTYTVQLEVAFYFSYHELETQSPLTEAEVITEDSSFILGMSESFDSFNTWESLL